MLGTSSASFKAAVSAGSREAIDQEGSGTGTVSFP